MISKDFCMYVRKKNDKLKGRKSQQRKNKYVKKKTDRIVELERVVGCFNFKVAGIFRIEIFFFSNVGLLGLRMSMTLRAFSNRLPIGPAEYMYFYVLSVSSGPRYPHQLTNLLLLKQSGVSQYFQRLTNR